MNSTDDVAEWLRAKPGKVRLRGSGSRQKTLPAAPDAHALDLRSLDKIVRLDPGDQTCTVQSGVLRAQLDEALAEHDLELPCFGQGTIGGLFASDPLGPAAAGGGSPRSLLLGIEAVLANGTRCKSGARVVKNVAGFDVHKLLVGSQGRLFVAAELHLRLKPRARTQTWFCNDKLEQASALQLLHGLRHEQLPPTALQLRREPDGSHSVTGRISGRAGYVAELTRRHGLTACQPPSSMHVTGLQEVGLQEAGPQEAGLANRPGEAHEVVQGAALPSQLDKVLSCLPDGAPFQWLGGGRFEAMLASSTASDRTIAQLAKLPVAAGVWIGHADRQPTRTPTDAGASKLADGLKKALDPDGILV